MTKKAEQPTSDLPKLAAPAVRALTGAGYTRLEQLTTVSEAEISELHGMGPNALKTLHEALAAKGWSFAGEQGAAEENDLPNIGKVARRELALAGYNRLEQFTKVSEKTLLAIHGVGPKATRILGEALAAKGWKFAE